MRLPIVEYPYIVSENLGHFASVFATREQQKHFCEYVTGLIASDKATVSAINDLFLNQNDQSALNKFLTQAHWDEQDLNRRRVQMEIARLRHRPVSEQAGRLIIDDTFAHHTRCSMEGLAYLRDRRVGHNVWAHDVVTSYYVNRSDQFPVDLRLYFQFNQKHEQQVLAQRVMQIKAAPTLANYRQYLTTLLSYHYRQQLYQAKTELGAQLVHEAVAMGVPFSVVLFDNWFLRLPLIDAIEASHKDWVGGCPKDRLVLYQNRWTQVQAFIRQIPASAYCPYHIGNHLYWVFSLVMPMKNLHRQRVRLLAVYEDEVKVQQTPLFFATNRTDWEAKRILTTYLDRWPTETFYEDVKGNLGFEAYQLRHFHAIRRHWYLCFVAYSLLSDQGSPGHSRWNVRGQFQATGQRCQAVVDELLGHLVTWIARQLEQGVSPPRLLQRLLA